MRLTSNISRAGVALRIAAILVIAAAPFVILSLAIQPQKAGRSLSINSANLRIEVATTDAERARGLCCRDSLAADAGMLFVYDRPGNYSLWMKDTKIPLDMYWIDTKKEIVHIEHNVQPASYPESFRSPTPAQYLLETNAGFAKKQNIKIGDVATF